MIIFPRSRSAHRESVELSFEIGRITVRECKKRHFLLGSIAFVGEAVALAMKTNYDFAN